MPDKIKIIISTGEGEVIEIIENVEDYNLDKPLAASFLMDDIKRAIKRHNDNKI